MMREIFYPTESKDFHILAQPFLVRQTSSFTYAVAFMGCIWKLSY